MKLTFTAAERRSIAETVERLNAFLDREAEHVESLDDDTLEIEGYERGEWTKFAPKDPTTCLRPKNKQ